MKRRMKKLMSLLLSVSMVFSVFTMPVYASPADGTESEQTVESETTETEDNTTGAAEETQPEATQPETTQPETTQPETITVEESYTTYTLNANEIDVSEVTPYSVAVPEDTQVDTDDPTITVVEEELGDIKVLNDEGESVALTQDQIDQILYEYGLYQKQWKANANLLGVQQPFFLSYNDNNEDGLGVLGEMLVLAGYSVDQVRSGEYSFDDLMMMIQNFLYADQYGLEYYGDAIAASRDAALKAVDESGAETMVQKMLVINDWIAHHTNFDMAYIMQDEDGNPIMVAEKEVPHEHYQDLLDAMTEVYTKQYHDQIYEGIKQNIYDKALESANSNHDAIFSQVKQGLLDSGYEDNEETDAIAEEQTQAQIKQIAEDAVTDAENNGIDVEQEDGTVVHTTIEAMTQQQMAASREDLGGASLNDIIPVIAQGMAEGIIGAWEGNHIGVLAEGIGVCAGYSKAFSYLLQYMSPEIYGINGSDSDMDDPEQWKTADDLYYTDGELDINKGYIVDMVRITFDADVTMFGEPSDFGEVHFWNAVNVGGKWYYVDPCYTDIYVECMSRDRVEIDGTMNHMYFMFSHTTALKMYDGNMDKDLGITTLYADAATDQSYEDSWFARVSSNAYSDGENFYYLYDSTDMLAMLNEYNNMQGAESDQEFSESDFEALMEGSDPAYKLVYHPITGDDIAEGGADSDFKVLIDFNPKDEDDNTLSAQVYNPETGDLEDNELLTELFAQYKEECDIYPSIKMTAALYGDKLYFNLSNCVLSYDLGSGKIEKVKEYNTVYASCDPTIAFRGMAYSVTDEETDMKVTNHPIAALTIKDDGQMYVSIATNFAFISGKEGVNDTEHYGYAYEESNYNPNYSSYMKGDSAEMEAMGYSEETNDNDEFMWSAVFVDTISMKDQSSCAHSNTEKVTVEPFCGRDGYTEERCTSCGMPIEDTRVVDEGSALDAHHYVHFDETYYTKDDNGEWNTGDCYVCTVCGFAIEKPDEPRKDAEEEEIEEYEKEKAIWENAVETAGHSYEPTDATWSEDSTSVTFSKLECSSVCPERKLDCLVNDDTISVECEETTAEAKVTGHEGECTTGVTVVYTAEGETEDGYKYTATNKVEQEPGEHSYVADFVWEKAEDEEAEVPYTVTATEIKCGVCGTKVEGTPEVSVALNTDKSKAATCTEAGKNVYTATATIKDADGNVLATATDDKSEDSDVVPATGHDYDAVWKWKETEEGSEHEITPTLTLTCKNDETEEPIVLTEGDGENDIKVTVDESQSTATCTEPGEVVYYASVKYDGKTYEDDESVTVEALGHKYEANFTWTEKKDSDDKGTGEVKSVKATVKCVHGCKYEAEAQDVDVTFEKVEEKCEAATCTKPGTNVYTATATFADADGKSRSITSAEKEFEVPATGHDWGEWETTKEPTESQAGEKQRVCKACGDSEKEEIACLSPVSVQYQTHIQSIGWEKDWKEDGQMSGTEGQALRLEAIKIKLYKGNLDYSGSIVYTTHVQSKGWLSEVEDGKMSGTSGEAKRLEAIKIYLTGEMAKHYDVYYCVHAQTYGWLNWAKNGEYAGTAGLSKRLEGIQIVLVKKGEEAPESLSKETRCYVTANSSSGESSKNLITYRTHVQTYGWQDWKYDGVMSGTSGEAKRLEGIEIKLPANMTTDDKCEGSIEYQTHIQSKGWEEDFIGRWRREGEMSGTSGQALRLEGIKIKLTGDLAEKYDVYYCVHAQTYGWLGWAKNGDPAGTEGLAKRLEGIKIVLVEKGGEPPKALSDQPAFVKK
ncbi:MAG: hypothetical protein ACI4S0_03445 [Dorea sp.]